MVLTEGKDPLALAASAKELRVKTETMKNLADDIGRWVDRLNSLSKPDITLESIEFNRLSPIGMAWMNRNELFAHDIDMIKDAMINICTTQITHGYKRMQELKEQL